MTMKALTRMARIRRIARFEIHAYGRRHHMRASTRLYESFAGNGMQCNPEAIFRATTKVSQWSASGMVSFIRGPYRLRERRRLQ